MATEEDRLAVEVVGYETLQFHRGGFFDGHPTENVVHLVRRTTIGTPGPTLCGRARFTHSAGPFDDFIRAAYTGDGWSVGGGIREVHVEYEACPACVRVADADLPISGSMFAELFEPIEPPGVVEGALLGQRSGAADGELSPLERARGTMTARRPVGTAPTAPESQVAPSGVGGTDG